MWKTCILKMYKKCEKMFCLDQFWSFVRFSFFMWFYVFAPGSHCFAIDKLNRSAICAVHFRSIWTAPLRFSTCRSWAGSKVTAAKLAPKNQSWRNDFRVPPSQLDFQMHFFRILFHIFNIFFHIFSKGMFNMFFFFTFFSKCILKAICFPHFFTCLWKTCENMWKKTFWKCVFKTCWNISSNMWKQCERRQLKRSFLLATFFTFFFQT